MTEAGALINDVSTQEPDLAWAPGYRDSWPSR
jgi:hypothetical protein